MIIGPWNRWISLGAGIMTLLMFVAIHIANNKVKLGKKVKPAEPRKE